MVSLARIVVVALLTVGFFAGANSAAHGETAGVAGSGVDPSVEAGGIQQLKVLVQEQQRQLEEHRRALEVHKALLQKLERKVAELSQVSSSEERASAGKQTLEVQNGPVPERSLAANAPSQVQASLTEPPKESVPEKEPQKEPRLPSSSSAQNLKVYWKEGLRLDSADKSQRLRIGGRIMNDWGFFSTSDQLNDAVGPVVNGTEFRRARLYLSGRMYDRVNFKAQYDFAGGNAGFKDVYIGIDKLPGAGKVQVGHFKEPFSLEMQTSSKYITFMERSLANVFAPERNSGMMIANTGFDKRLTWALGAFRDSDSFGEASGPGNYAVTGRVTTSPWSADGGSKLLHLGLAYSHRNPTGDTLRIRQRPETHLTTRFVDTGRLPAESLDLVGVEAAVVVGPASFQSEYIHNSVFNVGSNETNHQLIDVARTIGRLLPEVSVVYETNSDQRDYRVCFDKIGGVLGCECRTSLLQGIQEVSFALRRGAVGDYTEPIYHNHRIAALNGAGSAAQRRPLASGPIPAALPATTGGDARPRTP